MNYKISKITDELLEESIDVLCDSIQDDPNKVYYFPEKAEREKNTKWIIRKMMTALQRFHHNYVVIQNSKVVAVSCWIPPKEKLNLYLLIKTGLCILPFKFGVKVFKKIISSFNISDSNINKFVPVKSYWQLFYLGVAPEHQGKGLGSAIIKPILDQAKENGETIILENFTVENTKFYEKNGFRVVTKMELEEGILMRLMMLSPNKT